MKKKGFVIALDGPDGVGKTTQLELLRDYLRTHHKNPHTTRASGGTPIGEALRNVSLSHSERPAETDAYISLAMFAALARDLQPRKEQGEIILIDRSPLAMVAYNAYGGRLPDSSSSQLVPTREHILKACADTCTTWQIDVLIFLDAAQPTLDKRRQKRRTEDYFENQNAAYHQRVRQGYEVGLRYLQTVPDFPTKIETVDASPDIASISQSIIQITKKHLPS